MDISERSFKLKKDKFDPRDYKFKSVKATADELPEEVDLREYVVDIYDQLSLGSCSGHAGGEARENTYFLNTGQKVVLSKLFLYWQARNFEGTTDSDSGAFLRDIMQSMQKVGICRDEFYPNDLSRFTETPSPEAIGDAENYKIKDYHRITTFEDVQHALAERKFVIAGAVIYNTFDSGTDGIVPVPKATDIVNGNHAINLCGYLKINGKMYVIVQNSWSKQSGDKGYYYLPKEYFDNGLVFDIWTFDVDKESDINVAKLTDFTDVEEGRWSEPYIADCVSAGLLNGFDDGTFRPEEPMTREQVATVLSKLMSRNQ